MSRLSERRPGFSRRRPLSHSIEEGALSFTSRLTAVGLREAQFRIGRVLSIALYADPAPPKALGHGPGGIRPCKRVENKIARLGQEVDKKPRQLGGESGGVNLLPIGFA